LYCLSFSKISDYPFGIFKQTALEPQGQFVLSKYNKNSWKYPKYEKIKMKCPWLRLWGPSEIHRPWTDRQTEPPLIGPGSSLVKPCKISLGGPAPL
jgi:hypothetical protein